MSTRLACAVDHDDARTGLGDEGIRMPFPSAPAFITR